MSISRHAFVGVNDVHIVITIVEVLMTFNFQYESDCLMSSLNKCTIEGKKLLPTIIHATNATNPRTMSTWMYKYGSN